MYSVQFVLPRSSFLFKNYEQLKESEHTMPFASDTRTFVIRRRLHSRQRIQIFAALCEQIVPTTKKWSTSDQYDINVRLTESNDTCSGS